MPILAIHCTFEHAIAAFSLHIRFCMSPARASTGPCDFHHDFCVALQQQLRINSSLPVTLTCTEEPMGGPHRAVVTN